MFRRQLFIVLLLGLACCTSTPEQDAQKHAKRAEEYLQRHKPAEAAIEYRTAVKALPDNAQLQWKLAQTALAARDLPVAFAALQATVTLDPANVEAKEKFAELLLAAGKTEEAARIASDLLRRVPRSPAGYVIQSSIALRNGKLDTAIALLLKAADLNKESARTMLAIGNLYLLKNDPRKALEWYDRALAAAPGDFQVHLVRGNFHFSRGNHQEGESEYRRAIELSRDKETLRIGLAELYWFQGRTEEAEKELLTVIREMDSQRARKVLAEIELEAGKKEEAARIVAQILRAADQDLDGKYLEGRIALAEKQLVRAKALFQEVIKRDASMARAHLYNGVTELLLGQTKVGKAEIEEAVRLEPRNTRARLLLAEIYLRENSPAAAEQQVLEVLRINPSNMGAALLLGDSFLQRKEWKRAEQVFSSVIRQVPKNPAGYFKMGLSRKLQKKPSEAAAYFARAVERDPKYLPAIDGYVFALAAAGQIDKARAVLRDRLEKDPANPFLWELAGRLQMAAGDHADAERSLQKAIETAPAYTTPYYELGLLFAARRNLPEAERRFREVIARDGKNVWARAMLGVVLNMMAKIDEANEQYRRVLNLVPHHALAANNLAANLCDYGRNLDEALSFAQIAREAAPEDPYIADTLGWVYFRKGLLDLAEPLVREAARALPENPGVKYHLGMVLAKKGKKKEAAAALQAALAASNEFTGKEEAKKTLASLQP